MQIKGAKILSFFSLINTIVSSIGCFAILGFLFTPPTENQIFASLHYNILACAMLFSMVIVLLVVVPLVKELKR